MGRRILKAAERDGWVDLVVSIEATRGGDPRCRNCSQSKFGHHCLMLVEEREVPRVGEQGTFREGASKYMCLGIKTSSIDKVSQCMRVCLALQTIKRCGESTISPPVYVRSLVFARHWSVVVEDRHISPQCIGLLIDLSGQ